MQFAGYSGIPIKQSEIKSRWSTIENKQVEFNQLFANEFWGNCYDGRFENSWVTYNPNKDGTPAYGYFIPKYNT